MKKEAILIIFVLIVVLISPLFDYALFIPLKCSRAAALFWAPCSLILIECIAEITSHEGKSLNSLLTKGSPTPIYLGKFVHNGPMVSPF